MCHTPEQEAVGAALEHQLTLLTSEKSFFRRMREELTRKREFWKSAVLQSGMTPIVPQGGYFMLVDWASLGPKPDLSAEEGYEDVRFVKWLAKNWKLHGIPPSAFLSAPHKNNLSNYIRINFYKKDETLEKGKDILINYSKRQTSGGSSTSNAPEKA
jgi:kynurenine--oxoglutarate transaminase/cysteine-S-conjugate beta-lyase/glutamine--phenylpyruvate transaminase